MAAAMNFIIFISIFIVTASSSSLWEDVKDWTSKWSKIGGVFLEDVNVRLRGWFASIDDSVRNGIDRIARQNSKIICKTNARICCDVTFRPDLKGLEDQMTKFLHGQHLVKEVVIKALKGHLRAEPKKALTLSFHGWTGGGKNFVSKMIAEHLFDGGMQNPYVHLFISTLHFPHSDRIQTYQDEIVQWIREKISQCERSVFIFDEVDKLPSGFLDCIKPFLDYHAFIDGYSFNKAIFMFLSNTAGTELTKKALNHWKSGKDRNSITLKDVDKLLLDGAFNEDGGLQHSSIVKNNLIDFFVPFLPLEKSHVELCARDEILSRNGAPDEKFLRDVADNLLYYPPNILLYSTSGCKVVSKKIDLLMLHDEL